MRYTRRGHKRKKAVGLVIVMMMFALLMVAVVYFIWQPKETPVVLPNIEGIDPYLTTSQQQTGQMNNAEEVVYYYNATPEIKEGSGSLVIDNPKGNHFYLAGELIGSDGRVIYRSGIIPPGFQTQDPAVATALEAGQEINRLVISVIDPDSGEVVATQEHSVTVTTK